MLSFPQHFKNPCKGQMVKQYNSYFIPAIPLEFTYKVYFVDLMCMLYFWLLIVHLHFQLMKQVSSSLKLYFDISLLEHFYFPPDYVVLNSKICSCSTI